MISWIILVQHRMLKLTTYTIYSISTKDKLIHMW